MDEDAWEKLEPGIAHPMQRLRAVRALVDAGIDCGVLMAPIVPGLSTHPTKIERTVKAIADSGARPRRRDGDAHARAARRDHFMAVAGARVSGLVDRYEHLYARQVRRPKDYVKQVQEVVVADGPATAGLRQEGQAAAQKTRNERRPRRQRSITTCS